MTHMDDFRISKQFTGRRCGVFAFAAMLGVVAFVGILLTPTLHAQATRQSRAQQRQPRAPQSSADSANTASAAGQNVVAVVNGEPITHQVLGRMCLVRWGNETLESLVNKHLITNECKRRGIAITEADIDAEVARVAKKFSISTEHWLEMLKSERDVSPAQYKRDIIWPALALNKLAADKLVVTQDQLDREMESEYGAKVQVRMISLTSESRAKQVLQLAQAQPDNFPSLAKKYSEDPATASAQGLIPPVRRHLGEPAVEKVVFGMQPGEISSIVHAANQYLIFRCEKHIPAATISPQFRQQTIERLKDQIVERNLRTASQDLFEQLQASAKIVNVINNPQLSKQSPEVAAFVNSTPISIEQLTEECVARYGRDMLDTEINFKLISQALKQHKISVSQAALDEEIGRAAEAFGYLKKDGTPDIAAWKEQVTEQEGIGEREYIRDAVWPSVALKQIVASKVQVTEEDLQKGFEANYGPRVEVLAIVLGSQRIAQEVWDMARKDPRKEFFGRLAEQYSIESMSRANYGEIPPIRRNGGQPQIEKEAFRLTPDDDLSGIVAMGDKFIIMKYLGKTTPVVERLDDVRPELTKDIHEKKLRLAMAEEFDRIRNAAQIDNFLAGTSQTGKRVGKVPARPASTSSSVKRGTRGTGTPVLVGPKK